jgi:hypothetical protein
MFADQEGRMGGTVLLCEDELDGACKEAPQLKSPPFAKTAKGGPPAGTA